MYSHKKTAFKPLYIHQQGNVQSVADGTDTCHKKSLTAPNKGHTHCDVKKWSSDHPETSFHVKPM